MILIFYGFLFGLNVLFLHRTKNEFIYIIFSHFIYNVNHNHSFNQTYHIMIFIKIKSNHNFNKTRIIYAQTT